MRNTKKPTGNKYWGIANLTFLPQDPHQFVIGFDTGPGNTLLDACGVAGI
ncbi:anhydro-N-acetylmuramic acid kinase [Coxiella-like endosymbiont]